MLCLPGWIALQYAFDWIELLGELMAPAHSRRFCNGCGDLIVIERDCPTCGTVKEPAGDDPLEFTVNLSVRHCEACGRVASLGTPACPSCGEPADPNEPTNPRKGSVNRAKLKALGDLMPKFRDATSVPEGEFQPSATVTDDQLLSYLNRHNVLSPDLLIGNLKAGVRCVDLSSAAAIGSSKTRRAFEGVLDATQELRTIYDEVASVRASEQFGTLHLLLLAAFQAALDLHLACASGVLAVTLEEASEAQRVVHVTTDRLNLLGVQMAAEVEAANVEVVAFNQVDRRLGAFADEPGRYEHAGRPDLAAVLVAGLRRHGDLADLGRIGANYFGPMLSVDPTTLPPEQGLVLYVLAAEVAASDDPLTLRRWTNVLLALLNEAYRRNPTIMATAVNAAEQDVEEAMVHLLSVGDTLRCLLVAELPIEAVRQQLTTSYGTLVEWVHRRLLNLLLVAKFVLQGRPKPVAEIAAAGFGTKYDWLTKTSDPRYAPAYLYVSAATRNADSHGDVDTSGPKIRLIRRDKSDRTKIVGVEELTDEEFGARLRDLLLTCHALRLSSELFRIEHHHDLLPPEPASRRRVIVEATRVLVGYFGLVRAGIQFDEQERVVVDAEEDERTFGRAPRDYLSAAFTLATLFRNCVAAELRVSRDGNLKCRVEVSVEDVLTHQALPDDVTTYSLLALCYSSIVEPRELEPSERYVQELIKAGARLLVQDIAALQQLRVELPRTKQNYGAALEVLIQKVELFTRSLRAIVPPNAAVAPRDSLLAGLIALERGLRDHQRLVRSGRWAAVCRRSERLERGTRIFVRWAN